MAEDEAPVVIIGGSLVGLSTAVFLGAHGVPSLVVERHPGNGDPPPRGARQPAHHRALPCARPAGRASRRPLPSSSSRTARSCRSSRSAARSSTGTSASINEGVEHLSPSPRLFITQIGLEPILRRRAEASGARLEYSSEAVGARAGRGRRVRARAQKGGARAHGAHALRRRRRRREEPDARAPRDRDAWAAGRSPTA